MPKKRSFNFKAIQGSSSNSRANGGADGDKKQQTVNERLVELRKLEGKDAAQRKRELADAVSQRSVPEHLQPILGQSKVAPPKPKRGARSRLTNRTPGPAAPKSWETPTWAPLLALRGGRRNVKKGSSTNDERSRPNALLRFPRMTGEEDPDLNTATLVHLSLKTAAEHWTLFDEEDLPALTELPLRLRLRLLSYLGFYGPAIDKKTLSALTTGSEPVQCLDLAGLAGHELLTFRRLANFLRESAPRAESASHTVTVAESWDLDEMVESALTLRPTPSRFSQLTHLSLSHPPPGNSSWRDLLSLSQHVTSVTHLSLAYWSRPTLTPNLTTATVSSQHSPDVSAGGSSYYSGIDHDLSEPAIILRQLSSNLLRLQWLDIEGCAQWAPALACGDGERTWDFPNDGDMRESHEKTPIVTAIFAQNWKNLQYLNCAQGWLPTFEGLCSLPRQQLGSKQRRLVEDYLKGLDALDFWKKAADGEKDLYEVEKRRANIWVHDEVETWDMQQRINDTRRQHACKPLAVDHGWERKVL